MAVSFVGSALLNVGSKHFFQRQRPSLWESIAPESTFSFPSGHAMGSMTLAVTLVLLAWNTRWRWPVLLLAPAFSLLVSVSRVYLGCITLRYPGRMVCRAGLGGRVLSGHVQSPAPLAASWHAASEGQRSIITGD